MVSVGTQLALALNALVPVFGADKITKLLSMGLKRGGKVKPKAKKAKKAKRDKK
jgi:hypothetical protein